MKLQLDTDKKTIRIDGNVELKELLESLEKLLPKGLWKEFTLENNPLIHWESPIIIQEKHIPYWPTPIWINTPTVMPLKNYEVFCSNNLKSGTFNIEC